MPVKISRAYDEPGARDGVRILVDGLWPRGVSKADLKISAWEKAIAPSKALRVWYGHDPAKWPEFRSRYRKELAKIAAQGSSRPPGSPGGAGNPDARFRRP